jgi:hypothetical protein
LYLFPNGRFVPRWTRWLVVGLVVYSAIDYFLPNSPLANSLPIGLLFVGLLLCVLVAQVYRYEVFPILLGKLHYRPSVDFSLSALFC